MEVDQKKTGGDMKVECKLRSGGDMPTPLIRKLKLHICVKNVAKPITMNQH